MYDCMNVSESYDDDSEFYEEGTELTLFINY